MLYRNWKLSLKRKFYKVSDIFILKFSRINRLSISRWEQHSGLFLGLLAWIYSEVKPTLSEQLLNIRSHYGLDVNFVKAISEPNFTRCTSGTFQADLGCLECFHFFLPFLLLVNGRFLAELLLGRKEPQTISYYGIPPESFYFTTFQSFTELNFFRITITSLRLIGTPPWKSGTGCWNPESCLSRAVGQDHHWGRAVTHNFTELFSSHRPHRFSFYTVAVEILQEVKNSCGNCLEIKWTLYFGLIFVDTLLFSPISQICVGGIPAIPSHFHLFLILWHAVVPMPKRIQILLCRFNLNHMHF